MNISDNLALFLALLCMFGAGVTKAQNVLTITVTNVATNITVDQNCYFVQIREKSASPTAAFDLTFSAPKSASVLFALAGAETARTVLAVHTEAVAGSLSYLEEHALTATRRAGPLREVLPTSGAVAADKYTYLAVPTVTSISPRPARSAVGRP